MKSLPFHIPEAWKWYPFRAEPPRIGHFKEYSQDLAWFIPTCKCFFYPPIYCGTKSFFILLKHYFALATSRTGCRFSPPGRKEARHGTTSTFVGGRYPKSYIFFNVWRHSSNRPLGPYSVRCEYRELPRQFDQLVVSVASVFRTSLLRKWEHDQERGVTEKHNNSSFIAT